MQVAVFGSGYVGLVMAACLSEVGHKVTCVDISEEKIHQLKQGVMPIYEPGLEAIVAHSTQNHKLEFTTSPEKAIQEAQIIFIAVGTPQDEDGSADLQYVLNVAKTIGQHLNQYTIVVDKSTVPVGTADKVQACIQGELDQRGVSIDFDVVSNPEFLKEGAAIEDFRKPCRIVVGLNSKRPEKKMRELYAPYTKLNDCLMIMDTRSAELTKYAANAMLATKISFMNQMSMIAESVGADIEQVRKGIGADPRIGYHFIYPGCGYGGSCFGKDVQALIKTAHTANAGSEILEAVESVNARQKEQVVKKLEHHFGSVKDKVIAVWGLAFKPGTDDMRDAPSRVAMETLWDKGAKVQAYDPQALEEAKRIYGDRDDLTLTNHPMHALEGADALVVFTEWPEFISPSFDEIKATLKEPVIIDGRNMYSPEALKALGFRYYGIGRGITTQTL